MRIYDDIELEFLESFYNDENKGFRKKQDRSYQFHILPNNQNGIVSKLCAWFEMESGEKLINKNTYLFLHKYEVGDFFDKHIDEAVIDNKNRAYVVGFHINDDYEGGTYKLYNPDFIIDKTPGVPYFFKSNRLHEITKITNGTRKSALMFINYEDLYRKSNLI